MDKKELLKKLVKAFHYEMDWESKENIDSAMTLCLPIIEEYAQSKVNNVVLDDVSNTLPDLEQYGLFDRIKLLSRTEKDYVKTICDAERRASEHYNLVLEPTAWYNLFKTCLLEWAKGNDY